jgi:hypothetical protein
MLTVTAAGELAGACLAIAYVRGGLIVLADPAAPALADAAAALLPAAERDQLSVALADRPPPAGGSGPGGGVQP